LGYCKTLRNETSERLKREQVKIGEARKGRTVEPCGCCSVGSLQKVESQKV
jgi:hypothetical protein